MSRFPEQLKPTGAFVSASWAALGIGIITYIVGLWNAELQLNEKGYYLTVLLFGLFAAVSLQKSVRDRMEGIAVSSMYYGLCWFGVGSALTLLTVGLWNASFPANEKGFYAMAYILSLFAAVTCQKNVRDMGPTRRQAEHSAQDE